MSLISNKIDRRNIKVGDHIYCYRKLHTYSHHGIYVEDNRVIQYTRTESEGEPSSDKSGICEDCGYQRKAQRGVVKSCLNCFVNGHHRVFRFEYGVSDPHFLVKKPGTCNPSPCDNPDIVVQRANEMLDNNNNNESGFGQYDLLNNNCESFAFYCKTGKCLSGQALSFKSKSKTVFKNFTEKPFTLKNIANTAVEAAFGYKTEVLKEHAIIKAEQQRQRIDISMSSSSLSGQKAAKEKDVVQHNKKCP